MRSAVSVVVKNQHTKTYTFKHGSKLKKKERKKSIPIVEEVHYDGDEKIKHEEAENLTALHEDMVIKEQYPSIKEEPTSEETNDVSIDADNSRVDTSSDDENIFLNIIKKAVNGENQLVFLDGVKDPIIDKTKPKKFMKRKKEYLSMEYWKKYRLTEEEAIVEFKRKELSDKYLKANYKCHNCLKGFSKLEMLMRHVKLKHDEVRLDFCLLAAVTAYSVCLLYCRWVQVPCRKNIFCK